MATKKNSNFLSELYIELKHGKDDIFVLTQHLFYYSDLLKKIIRVPEGFETDFASVPRVPIAYWFWGGRAHREAVIHDYLYRIDSNPIVSFDLANSIFLEAMKSRNKPKRVRWPMYLGVCLGGKSSYHKRYLSHIF